MKASMDKCYKYGNTKSSIKDKFDKLLDYHEFIDDY